MNQNIKAFIFDIFGVLCEEPYSAKWEREHLSDKPELKEEFDILRNDIDRGKKLHPEYYQAAARLTGKAYQEIYEKMETGFIVNKSLFSLIFKLRKMYKTAICSNSVIRMVERIFDENKISLKDYFDAVIISSEVGAVKPEAAIFQHCVKLLGLKPKECVFIDDNEKNLIGARTVGMQTYHFTNQKSFEDWLIANSLK